jgi:pyruvate,water dikinase
MDLKLWATAQAIRSDPAAKAAFLSQPAEAIASAYRCGELPAAAQQALKTFLDAYGMRAVGEIDMGRPRWREDPRSIIQNLSSYLRIDDPNLAPDRVFQEAGHEAEKLAADLVAQVRQRKGRLRAWLLSAVIRRMRLLGGMRELPKFCIIKFLDALRTVLLRSGHELVTQGKLDCAEDIFFIPLDDLRAAVKGSGADLRAIVNRERADYNRELSRRQIPRLLLSTGEVFYQGLAEAGTNDLVGDGVSSGTVEGRVRVVHDPRGVRLEPGEILVCPATDPGWTPLFLSAGGLVMELGGMMTHGSVVAREYGIPAVVGVHEATKRLKTGQLVRVDGSSGRVIMLEQDAL